ncbi:MAG TPA: hypothetical protein VMB91_03280 [Solirubrobacteraceae bacterium]|nr:hypothetical protein [Solirubrobacteraceae bacterium]
MASRTLALTFALTLALAAVAFAGPLKGKTYNGTTSTTGQEGEHHKVKVVGHTISLKVASNGKKVSVKISFGHPLFYCSTQELTHVAETSPATISSNGSFKATIAERFSKSVGPAPITQVVTGRFSGSKVSGTIRTEAAECSGTTSFSAHA